MKIYRVYDYDNKLSYETIAKSAYKAKKIITKHIKKLCKKGLIDKSVCFSSCCYIDTWEYDTYSLGKPKVIIKKIN